MPLFSSTRRISSSSAPPGSVVTRPSSSSEAPARRAASAYAADESRPAAGCITSSTREFASTASPSTRARFVASMSVRTPPTRCESGRPSARMSPIAITGRVSRLNQPRCRATAAVAISTRRAAAPIAIRLRRAWLRLPPGVITGSSAAVLGSGSAITVRSTPSATGSTDADVRRAVIDVGIERSSPSRRLISASGSASSSRRTSAVCWRTNANASARSPPAASDFTYPSAKRPLSGSRTVSARHHSTAASCSPACDASFANDNNAADRRCRESCSFFFDPSLELRRARQIKAVEERTARQRDRASPIADGKRGVELGDVTRYRRRIERQHRSFGSDDLQIELASQRVARLPKGMAGALFVRLWPEQPGDSLARNSPFARGGENGQKRESRRSQSGRGRSGIGLEPHAAERDEAQHSPVTLPPIIGTVKQSRAVLLPRHCESSDQRIGVIVHVTFRVHLSCRRSGTGIFFDPVIVPHRRGKRFPFQIQTGGITRPVRVLRLVFFVQLLVSAASHSAVGYSVTSSPSSRPIPATRS